MYNNIAAWSRLVNAKKHTDVFFEPSNEDTQTIYANSMVDNDLAYCAPGHLLTLQDECIFVFNE